MGKDRQGNGTEARESSEDALFVLGRGAMLLFNRFERANRRQNVAGFGFFARSNALANRRRPIDDRLMSDGRAWTVVELVGRNKIENSLTVSLLLQSFDVSPDDWSGGDFISNDISSNDTAWRMRSSISLRAISLAIAETW
jgi:hypothetical protein